ncbi:MAG: nucleotide sugar dehydrogenase [Actinomycetota bacterium]|nr:nucleotide sugar dehydrogenase [Actinomycetota bacterium]
MATDFEGAVERRELVVGVVGLGYVGLPLVVGFAEVGYRTIGFDVDAERVAVLNSGVSHIEDVTDERVAAVREGDRFTATDDPAVLGTADAIFIAVPTPFDEAKTPDLRFVRAATDTVAGILRPDMLVILQSTTFPGTTTEVVQPVLERSGMTAGEDFGLAFSPERVDPGNTQWTLRNTPKVVGGVDRASAERAAALLESAMDEPGLVTVLSSPAAAEMAKLLENTYRAVNIALVNELAVLSHEMDVDIWEVIDGAGTKPFGFQAFYPGIGPGGHCIPVDPYYLSWRARVFDFQTKFIELAADTNLGMARYATSRVQDMLNDQGKALRGARVLVLGAAFKPNVSDMRNSRSVRVMELLIEEGADLRYHDPYVPTLTFGESTMKSVELTPEEVDAADIVIVLVAHRQLDLELLRRTQTPVFDAVNATRAKDVSHIERL